jgi:hypothetical protein|tara:strand:+ start:177 stop:332 length:156 start_codon:yes stop_codon:yes gene_type:complete
MHNDDIDYFEDYLELANPYYKLTKEELEEYKAYTENFKKRLAEMFKWRDKK